ncbi:MAG: hypothetical protein H6888_03295 [Nitratireductor sp.]|nr:hypothetical protein [Nitratireductor sp.]MCC0020081.1 hypothetical protein [Nitratireductor sp.]
MKKFLIATTTAIALSAPAVYAANVNEAPQFSQDEQDLKIMKEQSEAVAKDNPTYMNDEASAENKEPYLNSETEAKRIEDMQTGSITKSECDPAIADCDGKTVTESVPNLDPDSEARDVIDQQNMQ